MPSERRTVWFAALGALLAFSLVVLAFCGIAVAAATDEATCGLFGGKGLEIGQAEKRGDYATAVRLLLQCAKAGDPTAQLDLGTMYALGHGVTQNDAEAVKWYRLAAAQRNAFAQFSLGSHYAVGHGVPQDYVQAHMWFNLASAQATEFPTIYPGIAKGAADDRDRLAVFMTPAQIAEAQRLAREWKPSRPAQQAAALQQPAPRRPSAEQIVSGSGFFVGGNGEVLTNAHVVEGCRSSPQVTGPGTRATARVIARDTGIDLALLKVSQQPQATARLRLTAKQGENVFAYGFPLAGLLSSGGNFTAGTVTALAGIRDDSRSLQISAPVQPGSSGGPLLDEAGNVVGIVVAKLDALKVARVTEDVPQNVNFAIKATVAADFLGAHGVRYTGPDEWEPVLLPSTIAERARAFTVRIECER